MQKNSCVKTELFIMLILQQTKIRNGCWNREVFPPLPGENIWEECQNHPWNYTHSKGRDKFGRILAPVLCRG